MVPSVSFTPLKPHRPSQIRATEALNANMNITFCVKKEIANEIIHLIIYLHQEIQEGYIN